MISRSFLCAIFFIDSLFHSWEVSDFIDVTNVKRLQRMTCSWCFLFLSP